MRVDDFIRSTVNNSRLTFPKIVRASGDPEQITDEILLGVCDPALMAGFIKRLAKRIKRRIRERRRRRKKAPSRYSISAPEGTATVSPEGITFTRAGVTPPEMPTAAEPGGIAGLLKNPIMLMIPAGLILMLMMKKKKK